MKNAVSKQERKTLVIAFSAIFGILIAAGAALVIWLTPWVWYDTSPKPLGEKMKFLGKKDYGCWLGFCDSKPGTTYYYGTDMNLEETGEYFGKAELSGEPKREGYSEDNNIKYRLSFKHDENNSQNFYLFYYTDGPQKSVSSKLPKTSKEHLIQIDYTSYQTAFSAL